MEHKIHVVAKDGKAQVNIGADVIELKDESRVTFKTKIIHEFVEYCKIQKNCVFYLDKFKMVAEDIHAHLYNSMPVAVCELKFHPKLGYLLSKIESQMQLNEIELLLDVLKDHLDKAGKELFRYVRDFKISAITDLVRQKDDKGNYIYSIQRTVRGGKEEKNDYTFPDAIVFNVPLFMYSDYSINIKTDLRFDFAEVQGEAFKVYFQLINYEIDEELEEQAREYIMEKMQSIDMLKFWGNLQKTNQTDSWRYQRNEVEKK